VLQVIQALSLVPQALVKSQLSNATSRLQELLPPQYFKNNQYFSSAAQSWCGFVCTALGVQLHSSGFALILQVWNYIVTGRELHYLFSIDIVLIVKT
jgi:hypothetical protein